MWIPLANDEWQSINSKLYIDTCYNIISCLMWESIYKVRLFYIIFFQKQHHYMMWFTSAIQLQLTTNMINPTRKSHFKILIFCDAEKSTKNTGNHKSWFTAITLVYWFLLRWRQLTPHAVQFGWDNMVVKLLVTTSLLVSYEWSVWFGNNTTLHHTSIRIQIDNKS